MFLRKVGEYGPRFHTSGVTSSAAVPLITVNQTRSNAINRMKYINVCVIVLQLKFSMIHS